MKTLTFSDFPPKSNHKALELLWAREKLRLWDDYRKVLYNDNHKQDMINHSLKYGLLSAYTSFVAVDYIRSVENSDDLVKVKQALPVPAGVSNYAIGAEAEIKKTTKVNSNSQYAKITEVKGTTNTSQEKKIKQAFLMKLFYIKKILIRERLNTLEIKVFTDSSGNIIIESNEKATELNQLFSEIQKEKDIQNLKLTKDQVISISIILK